MRVVVVVEALRTLDVGGMVGLLRVDALGGNVTGVESSSLAET